MKLYHPKWAKFLILPAIILLLCISYTPIFILFFEDNPNYQSLYIMLPIAIFFTYFSFRGYALHKYRDVSIEIKSNSQIIVKEKGRSQVIDNADISYKNYKTLTFIELFDKNNNKFAAFDHIYPNVETFIRWARKSLNKTLQPTRGAYRLLKGLGL